MLTEFGDDGGDVLVFNERADCLNSNQKYLLGRLLDEVVAVVALFEDGSHEVVHVLVVVPVGDAAGLDDQQTLEGVDDFLDRLPLFGGGLDFEVVAFQD